MEFDYDAKELNGSRVRGTRNAANEREVLDWIRANGWIAIDISQSRRRRSGVSESDGDSGLFSFFIPRVRLRDKLLFFRQFAAMIAAGVSITSSLTVLSEQTESRRLAKAISMTRERVGSGRTLADSLAEHIECFGALTIPLVRSGEESGTLDISLEKIAAFIEAQDNLRKRIITALTYPAAVMLIALLVLGIMVAVVIPRFEKAFEGLNVELPPLTLAAFKTGRAAQNFWFLVPLFIVISVIAFRLLRAQDRFKLAIDTFMLKIPVFGDIILKSALARSLRTFAMLLRSGVPLLSALEMSADVAGNEKIKAGFLEMREGAAAGRSLNEIVREKDLFPRMIAHMIAVGE